MLEVLDNIPVLTSQDMHHKPFNEIINHIYLDDVMNVLKALPDQSIDLVYGDPDYNVGIKYNKKSYTVKFDQYIDWYIELCKESMRVLKDNGNLFMINYPKQNNYLAVKYLYEAAHDVHDYVWVYNTNVGHSPKKFTNAHRSILHATKSKHNRFYKENVAEPYKNPNDKRIQRNVLNGSNGRMPYSWFYYNLVKNVSKQKTIHACQIPQGLSEKLILSGTQPEDTVLVLFGGSGSEIDVCMNTRRNFVSAELDETYYRLVNKRIADRRIPEEYKLNFSNEHQ